MQKAKKMKKMKMNKAKPQISVVLPVYNAEKYIKGAIESILNQTFKDFELIIVNDASTDNTLDILKEYAKRDKRIVIVNNKENLYIAGALNEGIKEAQADIIARMDADDISYPQRFQLQYDLISTNENMGVVGCNIEIINEEGNIVDRRKYPTTSKELKKVILRYSPFAHPATMFRKKCWEEFGGYDGKWSPSEDLDLWFKIGSKYDFGSVSSYLFCYRVFMASHSNKKERKVEFMVLQMRLNAIKNLGYKPSLYDLIYNFGQFITLFIMPVSFRIWLYNFLRNKRII